MSDNTPVCNICKKESHASFVWLSMYENICPSCYEKHKQETQDPKISNLRKALIALTNWVMSEAQFFEANTPDDDMLELIKMALTMTTDAYSTDKNPMQHWPKWKQEIAGYTPVDNCANASSEAVKPTRSEDLLTRMKTLEGDLIDARSKAQALILSLETHLDGVRTRLMEELLFNNKIIANMHADIKKIRNAAVAINIQNAKSDNVISLNTQDILDLTAKYVRKES